MSPKVFLDKNRRKIKAGDVLYRTFYARWRERPGAKKVVFNGISGQESIVPDEGRLLEAEKHWVTYKVKWAGACLIAERLDCSDNQVLSQAAKFDEKGTPISEGAEFYYFNNAFKSTVYEICKS